MNFGFKDAVKLASKGFKPTDIAELSALDETKFDKDDILSLIGNGYKLSEIKDLVKAFEPSQDEKEDGPDEDKNDDHLEKSDPKSEDKSSESSDDNDNIDYKSLYEKEKELREKLQHKNQTANKGINNEKSDFDIALDIANSI